MIIVVYLIMYISFSFAQLDDFCNIVKSGCNNAGRWKCANPCNQTGIKCNSNLIIGIEYTDIETNILCDFRRLTRMQFLKYTGLIAPLTPLSIKDLYLSDVNITYPMDLPYTLNSLQLFYCNILTESISIVHLTILHLSIFSCNRDISTARLFPNLDLSEAMSIAISGSGFYGPLPRLDSPFLNKLYIVDNHFQGELPHVTERPIYFYINENVTGCYNGISYDYGSKFIPYCDCSQNPYVLPSTCINHAPCPGYCDNYCVVKGRSHWCNTTYWVLPSYTDHRPCNMGWVKNIDGGHCLDLDGLSIGIRGLTYQYTNLIIYDDISIQSSVFIDGKLQLLGNIHMFADLTMNGIMVLLGSNKYITTEGDVYINDITIDMWNISDFSGTIQLLSAKHIHANNVVIVGSESCTHHIKSVDGLYKLFIDCVPHHPSNNKTLITAIICCIFIVIIIIIIILYLKVKCFRSIITCKICRNPELQYLLDKKHLVLLDDDDPLSCSFIDKINMFCLSYST